MQLKSITTTSESFVLTDIFETPHSNISITCQTILLSASSNTSIMLFFKHVHAHRRRTTVRNRYQKKDSVFRIFYKSKFIVSVLLVLSFLILAVLPTLVQCFYVMSGHGIVHDLLSYSTVLYTLSDTVDGLIYIFIKPCVRKLLTDKINVLRGFCTLQLQKTFYSGLFVISFIGQPRISETRC